jgi:perosamine synthetase
MKPLRYSFDGQFDSTVKFMKQSADYGSAQSRALELIDPMGHVNGYLVPLSEFHLSNKPLIEKFSLWRRNNQFAYPNRFQVSIEGTETWLKHAVIENPDRLLFIVLDKFGESIGHLGVLRIGAGEVEIDNVLRGEARAPGIMYTAMEAIENFCYHEFGLESISLRVLKSNPHAIDFYEKLHYSKVTEIPLADVGLNGTVKLVESTDNVCDYFQVMQKNLRDSRADVPKILTAGPSISSREVEYVRQATSKGWNAHNSDFLLKFQQEFAEYVGAEYAIATSSCTGALHLSLLALGVGPGDEVIVPEVTWVATASVVRYVGATPVFADIDPRTWCIDPISVEQKITAKTKAIMPVHLYGFAADMGALKDIANRHDLHLVEDAAPAIGTLVGEKAAGTFGEFGAYSFQGAKMLVTGEGGMLVTSDEELYKRAHKIQDHGRRPGTFWIDELGFKYKMNNMTAAFGLAQLQRGERQIEQKRRIASWYAEAFDSHPKIRMQHESSNTRSIHWMNSVLLARDSSLSAPELIRNLGDQGIDTRPVFPAISQYPIWGAEVEAGKNAEFLGSSGVNIPSGVGLSKHSVNRVISAILKAVGD